MTEKQYPSSLLDAVVGGGTADLGEIAETAWIEVIRKMDEVYSDLIRYEVDLEKKNAALEQAQQFIGSVMASMSDILVVCDQRGLIQQVNPALLLLTGFAPEDLLYKPMTALLGEADAKALRPSGVLREHEVRLRARDGGFTDLVALNCSPRLDRHRHLPGTVIVGRPVGELRRAYEALHTAHTDLKQAQKQLIQSEKMASLGRLVAGVAHELNNPISFLYGNVHTLARYRERIGRYLEAVHGGVGSDELAELRRELKVDALMKDLGPLIDGTLEGAERVSEIVRNLRRLSFVNAADRQRVNLAPIIRNALHWVVRAARRPIATEDHLMDDLPLNGNEGPLHQVMVNLVQNAVDACVEVPQPTISVSGRQVGDQLVVVVRDNGPGIDGDHLLKVFDPFFTTKTVGQGTGLGLWVSWSIIRDHGGVIEAANAPDGGAAFTIIFPAVDA